MIRWATSRSLVIPSAAVTRPASTRTASTETCTMCSTLEAWKMENGKWQMGRSRRRRAVARFSIYLFPFTIFHGLTGCATKQPPPPEPVSHAPLIVDDAMRQRQWPISVAHYANGQTVAWPTGSLLKHPDTEPYWQATV